MLNSPEEIKTDAPAIEPQVIETESLSSVLAESSARLKEADAVTPKKRGRKPGQKNRPKTEIDSAPVGNPSPTPQIPAGALIPTLAVALKMPFDIYAQRTNFPGFRLDDAEATGLAQQLDQALTTILPAAMNSKYGALGVFCVSMTIISVSKYAAYQNHVLALRAEAAKNQSVN